MSQIATINFDQLVFASNNDIKTDSIKVAEAFGKLHKNVTAKIKALECSPEFAGLNFKLSKYEVVGGKNTTREEDMYEMTKDGFMFLVMGFTGKAAAQIKEAYINAFNLMHAKLFPKRNALVESPYLSAKDRTVLKDAVNKISYQGRDSHGTIYWRLFRQYGVDKVELLPAGKIDEMLAFLGFEGKKLEQKAVLPQIPDGMALVSTKWIRELEMKALPLQLTDFDLSRSIYTFPSL